MTCLGILFKQVVFQTGGIVTQPLYSLGRQILNTYQNQ